MTEASFATRKTAIDSLAILGEGLPRRRPYFRFV